MVFSCQIRPTCQPPPVPIFGVNTSASDLEEFEHTLLATNNVATTDIHVNPGDADRYESLVV
jgi:hypothetical protein